MIPSQENPARNPQGRSWSYIILKAAFYFIIVLAAGIAFWTAKANEQKRIVNWVEENDGSVWFENEKPVQVFVPQEHRYPHEWKWIPLPEDWKENIDKNYEWNVSGVDFISSSDRNDLMAETDLADITPLAELKHLKYVRIGVSQVSDLTPLRELHDLVEVTLIGSQVSDLSPLSGLTKLETITIGDSEISDLSPIAKLKNLQTLNLYNSKITDLTPLSDLQHLSSISLYSSQVKDISVLGELSGLVQIELPFTKVANLEPLLKLKKLNRLVLQSSPVTDLETLEKLAAQLNELNVMNTKLPKDDIDRIRKKFPHCKIVGP